MYTARHVSNVVGMPPGRLRAYLKAGFVRPERGQDGELRFSFGDLVLLRKAEGLVGRKIPARRVQRALRKLQTQVGTERPLSGMSLSVEGGQVVVEESESRWCIDSGQMLLAFERPRVKTPRPEANVAPLALAREVRNTANKNAEAEASALSAQELFEKGCALEDEYPAQARAHYRKAVELEPNHADAHVNLGRLLHEAGHPEAAQAHYRVALSIRPEDATASFNLGVALEDTGHKEEAVELYELSISLDSGNADAHYNLARLLEQLGKSEQAIRHLLIYRRLTRGR
jgi:tetratricopeptide (TPR) repeat protein